MPLNVHKDLKKKLIHLLIKALPNIEVQNGMFISSRSRIALYEANQALPDHGPLCDRLIDIVDDFPFMTFCLDSLREEFLLLEYSAETKSQKLTEVDGYGDAESTASRLVQKFDSLPWGYTLILRLPNEVSSLLSKVIERERILSSTIAIIRATKEFSAEYSLNSDDPKRQERIHGSGASILFAEPKEANWDEEAVYLRIQAEGFIGPYGGSGPALKTERLLKAFLGLGIALRLFRVDHSYYSAPPESAFFVFKTEGDKREIAQKLSIGTDLSRALHDIKLHNLVVQAETESKKQGLAQLMLDEMAAVFAAGERAQAILLAAEWLIDSHDGRDTRLNYVQAIVVLEVLLGDKAASDEIGLGQLLRNRCAYLIGANQDERSKLLKDFDDIYRVRSQIVHRGKFRLTFKESMLFDKLQNICNRVIQKEVDLLRANKSL